MLVSEAAPSPTDGQQLVRPFSRAMIADFLTREKLKFLRDQDDDCLVTFDSDESVHLPEIRVWFTAEGKAHDIYSVRAYASPPPERSVEEWYRICNQYNRERRWPKAYMVEGKDALKLRLESQIDLGAGIHQQLFDDFGRMALAGIYGFFEWLNDSADAGPTEDTPDPSSTPE